MKKMVFIFSLLFILLLIGCKSTESENKYDFFFWINGYVAVPVNSEYNIAFTYYYRLNEEHLDFGQIDRLQFLDIDNNAITISKFEMSDMDFGFGKIYSGKAFNLSINFKEKGIYESEYIELFLRDGTKLVYPVGQWIFDIDDASNGGHLIDQTGSPAASSINNTFPFRCEPLDDSTTIRRLYYSKDKFIIEENILISGNISLNPDAPINYIKPKILINAGGDDMIAYGPGCYCGALDVDEDDVKSSLEQSNKKLVAIK